MSGVDRAALIEAAHRALYGSSSCSAPGCPLSARVVDAVLPLVADAIEDLKLEYTHTHSAIGANRAYLFAARLVRSLAEEGQTK